MRRSKTLARAFPALLLALALGCWHSHHPLPAKRPGGPGTGGGGGTPSWTCTACLPDCTITCCDEGAMNCSTIMCCLK